MKHIIILADGLADHKIERLGDMTPVEYASTPAMDFLAREGVNGQVVTIPEGFQPGSEVANSTILGYDQNKVYEGRGVLEAASIGYDVADDEMAMRCNLLTIDADGNIANHHGGHLTTDEGRQLIDYLNEKLGSERVKFVAGIQYRHLLVIKGGSKYVECAPPHDHPGRSAKELSVRPMAGAVDEPGRMTAAETAALLNQLIEQSGQLLAEHPVNVARRSEGRLQATHIWPWSPGYRPAMKTLSQMFPQIKSGAVISAVDLIKGIGRLAGLEVIEVEGATGLANTNYEGKAAAAIDALHRHDFVFLHVEATDEAGHDGDLDLKVKAIEYLDHRVVAPIIEAVKAMDEKVTIALLPDHATPVEERVHRAEPVPVAIWHPGIVADDVNAYSEPASARGSLGMIYLNDFIKRLMAF